MEGGWQVSASEATKVFLLIARLAVNGRVRKFRVVLRSEKGWRLRCLTLYDTAHGYAPQ